MSLFHHHFEGNSESLLWVKLGYSIVKIVITWAVKLSKGYESMELTTIDSSIVHPLRDHLTMDSPILSIFVLLKLSDIKSSIVVWHKFVYTEWIFKLYGESFDLIGELSVNLRLFWCCKFINPIFKFVSWHIFDTSWNLGVKLKEGLFVLILLNMS